MGHQQFKDRSVSASKDHNLILRRRVDQLMGRILPHLQLHHRQLLLHLLPLATNSNNNNKYAILGCRSLRMSLKIWKESSKIFARI